jgi:hypothetical protein
VKFLSCNRMFLDQAYCLLFTQWFQRKNLKTTPTAIAVEFEHPELCCFMALSLYWAGDNGLVRPNHGGFPTPAQRRRDAFVFQDLHDMNDASVARQLSNIIKSVVHHDLEDYYSIKSARVGAMTHLAWDPVVTYEESVALGGWSKPSNSDWYIWTYLVALVLAALSLSGYPNPRVLAPLPEAGKIFHEPEEAQVMTPDGWTSFVHNLFPCSLNKFRPPRGRLCPLLVIVTTVMIMHFRHFYNKLGPRHRLLE